MERLVEDTKLSKDDFLVYNERYEGFKPLFDEKIIDQILNNQESIEAIRDWISVMRDEPESLMKLSEVYHSLRRMLGDE